MNTTLTEYVKKSDNIINKIFNVGIGMNKSDIKDIVSELYTDIKLIQSVSRRLADVANACKDFLPNTDINEITNIDPMPDKDDHVISRTMINENNKNLVDEIEVPVITVESEVMVPVSNIYYIRDINQYAVNIQGTLIKGGLLDIKHKPQINSRRCHKKDTCINLKNNTCEFYHPSTDYITNGLNIPSKTRVLSPASWVYCKKNKKYTRKIGGVSTITNDIKSLTKNSYTEELHNRESQLIHDILVYQILHKNKLLPNYEYW